MITDGDFMFKNDELKIYRGEDYEIAENIVIHQPTLAEICDYGEQKYYSMIYQLTATPQSMKYQLWEVGIDYTKITPFELFYSMIYKLYPVEETKIIFGNLDFQKFKVAEDINYDNNPIVLYQIDNDGNEIMINEVIYESIMDYLRDTHLIEKDEKIPGNESTKMILIEDAKDEYLKNKSSEYHSRLKNLISSMVNSEGFKYNHTQVWSMKINAFMDSVKRISKIKNAYLLLQSGYSGFGITLKDIDKKQLDWLGEL